MLHVGFDSVNEWSRFIQAHDQLTEVVNWSGARMHVFRPGVLIDMIDMRETEEQLDDGIFSAWLTLCKACPVAMVTTKGATYITLVLPCGDQLRVDDPTQGDLTDALCTLLSDKDYRRGGELVMQVWRDLNQDVQRRKLGSELAITLQGLLACKAALSVATTRTFLADVLASGAVKQIIK